VAELRYRQAEFKLERLRPLHGAGRGARNRFCRTEAQSAQKKRIACKYARLPTLGDQRRPPCAPPILENLLANAIRFTPGGRRVRLLRRSEGLCAVSPVRDTGRGKRRSVPAACSGHHDLLRIGACSSPGWPVLGRTAAHLLGGGAQGESRSMFRLPCGRSWPATAPPFPARNLPLRRRSAAHPRDVDVDHFVGALRKLSGWFRDVVVCRPAHRIVTSQVLNIHPSHVDTASQQFQHIFVALAVSCFRERWLGQLVHHYGFWMAPGWRPRPSLSG